MPIPDCDTVSMPTRSAKRGAHPVFWVIATLLAVIAVELGFRETSQSVLPQALGQVDPRVGARGVYAFTGQLDKNTYGLFMLDVDTGTIWCYEFRGQGAKDRKMELVAGRLWIYDRYLENFNQDEPTPEQVADLIEQMRQAKLDGSGTGGFQADRFSGR